MPLEGRDLKYFLQVKEMLVEKYLPRALKAEVLGMHQIEPAAAAKRAGLHVHAVGIGRKLVKGEKTNTLAVRLYVIQKVEPEDPADAIPPEINGVPTDVIESEPAFFNAVAEATLPIAGPQVALVNALAIAGPVAGCSGLRQMRHDPITAGFNAGSNAGSPGTIACFCRSTVPGETNLVLALSCSHVFAGPLGGDLFQPAPGGGGFPAPLHFAELHRSSALIGGAGNRVDAAVGRLLPGVTSDPTICSVGRVSAPVQATQDMSVVIHGQATGFSKGSVEDPNYTAIVGSNPANSASGTIFPNQIRIEGGGAGRFANPGDSGSLVVEETAHSAVGLLFSAPPTQNYATANPIGDVLSLLQLTII